VPKTMISKKKASAKPQISYSNLSQIIYKKTGPRSNSWVESLRNLRFDSRTRVVVVVVRSSSSSSSCQSVGFQEPKVSFSIFSSCACSWHSQEPVSYTRNGQFEFKKSSELRVSSRFLKSGSYFLEI